MGSVNCQLNRVNSRVYVVRSLSCGVYHWRLTSRSTWMAVVGRRVLLAVPWKDVAGTSME